MAAGKNLATEPLYRYHKARNCAVVRVDGKDFYLGEFGSAASYEARDRILSEWLANGRTLPRRDDTSSELTVNEIIVRYLRHAQVYYKKAGRTTSEYDQIKAAMRVIRRLYGRSIAAEFGPQSLKACRAHMIETGWARRTVNKRVSLIVRMFSWAVEEELVPADLAHGLREVRSLAHGRSEARETDAVQPVPQLQIDAVLPLVSRPVAAMVRLQLHTGMRPGEVCAMRPADIDMGGQVWLYVPRTHKTEHHGHARRIYLGPAAQRIVRDFLGTELEAHLFSPIEAEAERSAERRRNRKSPMTPSQAKRRKKRGRPNAPRDAYDTQTYGRAILRACGQAFGLDEHDKPLIAWSPNRLRHNYVSRIEREFGVVAASVLAGHATPKTTEVYVERDAAIAVDIAAKTG